MSSEDDQMRRPEDHGRWEGDTFHFEPPVELPDGRGGTKTVRSVMMDGAMLEDGISKDDVIHAMLNQIPEPSPADECAAGRYLNHPDKPAWRAPCPNTATIPLVVHDEGADLRVMLCAEHEADMESQGLLS